tara:strand:+ start:604 stop:1338 length:735 start_codon:yes stop_codon:yes gene_type:complete
MKIRERKNQIEIYGSKMKTSDRPPGLAPFLNYYGVSLLIGLPASGKSSLIKNMLYQKKLYNKIFHSIYYISPSTTLDINLPDDKRIILDDKELNVILEEIIEEEKDLGEEGDNHNVLIILDDAVNFLNTNKKAMNTFRKISMNARHILGNHSSLMVWLVSQKIKSVPLTIRSQANSIYFFDSTNEEKKVFIDEFLPLTQKQGETILNFIFEEPYSFAYVNMYIKPNDRIFKKFNQLIIEDLHVE